MNGFSKFNLNNKILSAIDNINFEVPTKLQELVLPSILNNKNICVKGKTGSGKTHCFIIKIATLIKENSNELQSIVLVPTRELALQIFNAFKAFFKEYNLKIALITGGIDIKKLEFKETPNIIIGTPEKIKSLVIDEGIFNLKTVSSLVIDEADMTLEMGFLNEVDRIAYLTPNASLMVFSATIPAGVKQFINKYFKHPLIIEDSSSNNNSSIEHILYPTRDRDKLDVLLNIVKHIKPYICMIFASRKVDVIKIHDYLYQNGYDTLLIHGDLESRIRKANIKKALDGKYQFIVCSDIASRGIDIDGVSHVISYDFPKNNLEFYTHRVGRAGRNNYQGISIAMYDKTDNKTIKELESQQIKFIYKEIKHDEFVEISDLNQREKRKYKNKTQEALQKEISKTVRKNKSKKVKPNYKKKVKEAVEKTKRKFKRQIIEKDIKRQIKERAIKKNKGEYND